MSVKRAKFLSLLLLTVVKPLESTTGLDRRNKSKVRTVRKAQTIPEVPVQSQCQAECCPNGSNICGPDVASLPLIFCCEGIPFNPGKAGKKGSEAVGENNQKTSSGSGGNKGNTAGGHSNHQSQANKGGGSPTDPSNGKPAGSGGNGGNKNPPKPNEENHGSNAGEEGGGKQEQGGTHPEESHAVKGLDGFRRQTLQFHNSKRRIHLAPALVLDAYLNEQAQEWADDLARRRVVEHSSHAVTIDGEGEGENIASSCSVQGTVPTPGKKVTDMWYKEIEKYDWNHPGYSPTTGHFTQLVWKNSKKMGIGAAKYKNGDYTCNVAVARYLPEGNVQGEFPANVQKGSYTEG